MEVNRECRKINIRCTEVCSYIRCKASRILSYKMEEGAGKQPSSPQQQLGTNVHTAMEEILCLEHKKREPMPSDVSRILQTPAAFVGLDLYRAGAIISEPFIHSDVYVYTDRGETPERLLEGTKYEVFKCDGCVKVLTNTRGPSGDVKVVGCSSTQVEAGQTTIEEALSLYPDIFGRELTEFESKTELSLGKVDGWEINLSGTLDAATKDRSLIVDWKTCATTPKHYVETRYAPYYMQGAIYRYLHCKSAGIPLTGCHLILAYLVKTKKVKFIPLTYKISDSMVRHAGDLISNYASAVIRYVEGGILPEPSIGFESCQWCYGKQLCEKEFALFPTAVDITEVLFLED